MNGNDFLERIRTLTLERVAQAKREKSVQILQDEIERAALPISLLQRFQESQGPQVVAEVKRQSPSKGAIALELDPVETALGYQRASAIAISVLTEPHYFGGSLSDLQAIRDRLPQMPLLRKDFLLDDYQLFEARAAGADVVLLIHSFLERNQLIDLHDKALELGLQVLVEVHSSEELESAEDFGAKLIGVNNRNLRTLKVDVSTSENILKGRKKSEAILISESGIESASQIQLLSTLGFQGFLIGTKLMQDLNPEATLRSLRSAVL